MKGLSLLRSIQARLGIGPMSPKKVNAQIERLRFRQACDEKKEDLGGTGEAPTFAPRTLIDKVEKSEKSLPDATANAELSRVHRILTNAIVLARRGNAVGAKRLFGQALATLPSLQMDYGRLNAISTMAIARALSGDLEGTQNGWNCNVPSIPSLN